MIGTVIGQRYEILTEIGAGALGTVYKAKNRESGATIALKVLHCADAEEATLKRFVRSVEATKILSHPNVIAPFDSGFINETTPYVVTAYCDGDLLSEVLKRDKHLSVERAIVIGAQICDALEHAHYYGVIHRNLKPANIMIMGKPGHEIARVLDFGLAKSFFQGTRAGKLKVTMQGEVIGTPEFMSPEQCRCLEIDWRSDIYSMGCLLYTMLTGKPPIKGSSAMETMMKQGAQSPAPFEKVCPENEIPGPVQEVVYRALCKEREERQQTMTQLRDELVEAADSIGLTITVPATPDAPAKKRTSSKKKPVT